VLAENDGERAGTVYEAFHEETDLGYTRYSEIINKLDQLGVIDAEYADVEGAGAPGTLLSLRGRDGVRPAGVNSAAADPPATPTPFQRLRTHSTS